MVVYLVQVNYFISQICWKRILVADFCFLQLINIDVEYVYWLAGVLSVIVLGFSMVS